MDLVTLLVVLLIFGAIFYVINNLLPIDQRFKNVALIVVCIILIIWLLSLLGVGGFHIGR